MDGVERVSGTRLLFRFGIGATELAGKRMITALQAVDAVLASAAAEPVPRGRSGCATRCGRDGRAAGLGPRRPGPPPGGRAIAARWDRPRSPARLAPPGCPSRADDGTTPVLARVDAQLGAGRWRGAVSSWPAARWPARRSAWRRRSWCSAVAESPELKRVIAEQSESLGASAMTDLREGSARADTLAERVTRRFLRRSR